MNAIFKYLKTLKPIGYKVYKVAAITIHILNKIIIHIK